MEKIQEELPFFRVLADSTRVEFQQLVMYCSKQRAESICEFMINILNSNIPSSEQNLKDLMKHKRVLYKLIRPELTVKERKTIIKRNAMLIQETITYYLPRLEKLILENADSSQSENSENDNEQENESAEDTSSSGSAEEEQPEMETV